MFYSLFIRGIIFLQYSGVHPLLHLLHPGLHLKLQVDPLTLQELALRELPVGLTVVLLGVSVVVASHSLAGLLLLDSLLRMVVAENMIFTQNDSVPAPQWGWLWHLHWQITDILMFQFISRYVPFFRSHSRGHPRMESFWQLLKFMEINFTNLIKV